MAELGSDTYTYSQVGFNYDGQAIVGDMSSLGGDQAAMYLDSQHLQQVDQEQQQEQQQQGYFPEADEDTFVPPPELNVPQGMVVVSAHELYKMDWETLTAVHDFQHIYVD